MTAVHEQLRTGLDAAGLVSVEGISWETYDRLLQEATGNQIRITYDQGRMVLMSPLPKHDRVKKWIARLLETASLEKRVRVGSFGSTTWRKQKLAQGLEPDECYYITNEPLIRGRTDIDLRKDPAPDLAIEIEITHFPVDRLAIYARLGVREIWKYNGQEVEFLILSSGGYVPMTQSHGLPFLNSETINRFLRLFETQDENTVILAFREFLASH
jgi:Uma2 family endonuclease